MHRSFRRLIEGRVGPRSQCRVVSRAFLTAANKSAAVKRLSMSGLGMSGLGMSRLSMSGLAGCDMMPQGHGSSPSALLRGRGREKLSRRLMSVRLDTPRIAAARVWLPSAAWRA